MLCAVSWEKGASARGGVANHRPASGVEDCSIDLSAAQDYFVSSFFRIRRSSMKFRAVIVHSTQPNMIITMVSMEAGSFPHSYYALPVHPGQTSL